jgi:hypothetical protein
MGNVFHTHLKPLEVPFHQAQMGKGGDIIYPNSRFFSPVQIGIGISDTDLKAVYEKLHEVIKSLYILVYTPTFEDNCGAFPNGG